MQLTLKGAGPAIQTPSERSNERNGGFQQYHDDKRGMVIDNRYMLEKLVGRGGIGSVYLATDMRKNEPVAVKIRDSTSAKSFTEKRITSEIRALSQVRHRNIVSMKDAGTCDGESYVVMEYMDGIDLDRYIRHLGSIPYPETAPIIAQICSGLGALHAQGIIHRDMKPHNVFLLKDGTVKIFDFDLSRFSGQEEPELHEGQYGFIIGTPSYIAPEAFSGQKPDHRADIYAVGMIMYRMLCGELPIDAKEVYGIIARLINEALPPPSSKNPSVPEKADRITMRALEKDPAFRYQSTEEMRRALLSGISPSVNTAVLRFGPAEAGPEDPTLLAGIITKTMRVAYSGA